MCQTLPVGNFSWLTPEKTCPKRLQLKTNDLPLAPEHLTITYDMLSPYSQRLRDKFNFKHTLPSKKLTPNFYPKKKNDITHYLNLQFYIEEGMIAEKYHRTLAFRQRSWLADYIHFNNEKRKEAKDDFTRAFCKKINNSFFGRLMLNQRKKNFCSSVGHRKRLSK
ncbi:uncharacterized protein CDAR_176941 [Caerostris darwini]|uniref:Uncharacterized protein n=1 Tax=Caerostris darwini TaxID=1538125 RepID=A0AAV4RDT9_9ARAC|nr:uncharacterized protein CDAR_176941 [Caerostris darwini]